MRSLLTAGRDTRGQKEEESVKTGLSGLEGKHPKPAGLALQQVKGQRETAEVERRQRGVGKAEIKKVKISTVGKVEIGTTGSVKATNR